MAASHCYKQQETLQYLRTRKKTLQDYPVVAAQGSATTPIHNEEFHLHDDIHGACRAAQAGCAFYQWILNDLLLQYPPPGNTKEKLEDLKNATFMLKSKYSHGRKHQLGVEVRISSARAVSVTPGIFVCAEEGNSAADDILTRPMDLDVMSPKSVMLSRECLRRCIEEHPECRGTVMVAESADTHADGSSLPTRLLELQVIADGDLKAKLLEKEETSPDIQTAIAKAGFAALSYCWGGPQEPSLTSYTKNRLRAGMHASKFSRTIHDAIKFTHAMGLEYLWVDALCILQDSPHDKATEIGRMSSYYGANTVTLLAASASAATQGFLEPRSDQGKHAVGPFRFLYRTAKGELGSVLLYNELGPDSEPISTRGWTLQESLLSNRMVIFSSNQLFWRCHTSGVGRGGSLDDFAFRAISHTNVFSAISPLAATPGWDVWVEIIKDYSRRSLGVAADKLLAVSAVAEESVKRLCRYYGRPIHYLAGLFHDPENPETLMTQLLWAALRPKDMSSYWHGHVNLNCGYRAPSWSWASVDGPIAHVAVGSMFFYSGNHVKTIVLAAKVQATYPTNPYGMVSGGFLEVKGPLLTLNPEGVGFQKLRPFIKVEQPDQWNPSERTLSLSTDKEEDEKRIESVLNGSLEEPLVLLTLLTSARDTERALGLVLKPAAAEDGNHSGIRYKRMGVFAMKLDLNSDQNDDSKDQAISMFFDRGHDQTLRLV
ncbi:het-domain-containing protein [Colletotrichum tofieldiae]|nr:het-domain-containing protein [Colletotrichum tofieldiae]